MPDLAGRVEEQRRLREALAHEPALIVLTGRRRVGKTSLLQQVLGGGRVVWFHADEQGERRHLELLAREAARVLPDVGRFDSWDGALTVLAEQAGREPMTVVLDDYHWLAAAQPGLDATIARHWDGWERSRLPIGLVLSGATRRAGGPLAERPTMSLHLEPLDFREASALAGRREPEALLRRWAVLGGTPQYQRWAGTGDLDTVIERILDKDGPLYDEPRHLLREAAGVRDPGTYLAILRAIATGAASHNRIAQEAGVPTGNLARKIERLEDLGCVTSRSPLGDSARGVRYEMPDPYLRFWFRHVGHNRSRLELGRVHEVLAEVLGDLDELTGRAFARCCRRWVEAYADPARFGEPESVGSWWSRDGRLESEIVGVRGGRPVLVGACRWERTAGAGALADVRRARHALGHEADGARLAVFARQGFTDELREAAAGDGVELVTASELFA